MIIFFYFTQDVRIVQKEFEFSYEHRFEKITTPDAKQVPSDKVYFSTPSDFQNHMDNLASQIGRDRIEKEKMVYILDPNKAIAHPQFPKHIGFAESIESQLEQFKGKKEVKIALINAMSNAIGDHLIGMKAFEYWQEKVKEYLKDSNVTIAFFQLNPMRMAPITKQWHPQFQQIYMLPNRMQRLVEYDAYIDFGSLLMRENFGNQPMIDFFFEALSIDAKTVPDERKRLSFKLSQEPNQNMDRIFSVLKSQKRPLLLFHHRSTSPIRQMDNKRARQYVESIIKNSDYFVLSACGLEFSDKRFMDISMYSKDLETFASIISKMDSIITVDTSTYHIADAFDIPTVVLFTTIEPEYRIKYYPFTRGIMLEEKDGPLYGRHKGSKKPDKAQEELRLIDERFEKLDVRDVLAELEAIKEAK